MTVETWVLLLLKNLDKNQWKPGIRIGRFKKNKAAAAWAGAERRWNRKLELGIVWSEPLRSYTLNVKVSIKHMSYKYTFFQRCWTVNVSLFVSQISMSHPRFSHSLKIITDSVSPWQPLPIPKLHLIIEGASFSLAVYQQRNRILAAAAVKPFLTGQSLEIPIPLLSVNLC